MKLAAICLFSAVYAAAYTLASDMQAAAATFPSPSDESAPEPTGMTSEDYAVLEARQAVPHDPNAAGVDVPTQFPTVTTDWRPTVLPNGQTTYWEDAYTQTFAKIPDQLPSPGSGSIGYGTLKQKNKRAEATPANAVVTVIAEPVVMIMQTTIIVQPIQRITEVQIVETVHKTRTPTSHRNATRHSASSHPSGTGVFLGTGTAPMGTGSYGTAVSSMPPAPYNDTDPEPWKKPFF